MGLPRALGLPAASCRHPVAPVRAILARSMSSQWVVNGACARGSEVRFRAFDGFDGGVTCCFPPQ
eukprot:1375865-Prymnesium_polylepis.1